MDMKTHKRYRIVGREEKDVLEKVRTFLHAKGKRRTSIFQQSGGDSGDMYVETAEYESFRLGRDTASLYSVIDDNTSGYAILMTCIVVDYYRSKEVEEFLELLESLDFTTSYRSFQKRPMNNFYFQSYLHPDTSVPVLFKREEAANT